MIGVLKFAENEWIVEMDGSKYPLHPYNKLFTNEKEKSDKQVEFQVQRDCFSGCSNTCYQCIHFKEYAILK